MDKHYLTPLFQPETIAVFSGKDTPERQSPQAVALVEALTAQRFTGQLVWDSTKPDGTPRKLMDVSRLASLGWHSTIALGEGLKATYSWFLANARHS